MRLDIELSKTEIDVIRLALEAYWVTPYKHGEATETLDGLRARFKDLASIPLPTP